MGAKQGGDAVIVEINADRYGLLERMNALPDHGRERFWEEVIRRAEAQDCPREVTEKVLHFLSGVITDKLGSEVFERCAWAMSTMDERVKEPLFVLFCLAHEAEQGESGWSSVVPLRGRPVLP